MEFDPKYSKPSTSQFIFTQTGVFIPSNWILNIEVAETYHIVMKVLDNKMTAKEADTEYLRIANNIILRNGSSPETITKDHLIEKGFLDK